VVGAHGMLAEPEADGTLVRREALVEHGDSDHGDRAHGQMCNSPTTPLASVYAGPTGVFRMSSGVERRTSGRTRDGRGHGRSAYGVVRRGKQHHKDKHIDGTNVMGCEIYYLERGVKSPLAGHSTRRE
jgi:hypothetical protein